ncbi:MAG: DUF4191 domain-containing protein [Micrococcales bacterium]|nr:DUF4191 domain-containing protein [Micrococcales bacterium]
MARQSTSADPTSAAKKPKKTRWYHQLWQAYKITQRYDPRTGWFIVAIVVGVTALSVVIGWLITGQYWQGAMLGLSLGLIGAMFLLARRVEVAAYSQIAGQPGATYSALTTMRRGWTFGQEPVAIDPRTQDMVFRGVGRPGVVLISEGPPHRAVRLLEAERKRCARVVGGAPVHLVQMGDDEGQVPLRRLTRYLSKQLKPVLTRQEVAAVDKRLMSLGAARLPVPKGLDPMKVRPDRKGLRGR